MTATIDPPALRGLLELEERTPPPRRRPRAAASAGRGSGRTSMGYQPGLDGIRAISVVAVILYHAGFSWMHGGFFGVEVFFVVSGYLITSLLLEEREGTGRVSLAGFWQRRARRLLPALVALLAAVAVWAALFGSAEQRWQLRRDLPWSLLYAANWGQILGDIPYFTSGDPPLLRHLWSLAVEEQWYLLWPLAFLALGRTRWPARTVALVLTGAAVAVSVLTFWLHAGGPGPLGWGPFDGADRTNLMYLSTVTRSGGLLLGAAAAFVWRPWRSPRAGHVDGRPLDAAAGVAIGGLLCVFASASLTDGYVYQWLLPLVSVLSLVVVLAVVHPAATGARRLLSWAPLVEVGRRSYGLYLWHWPIFVVAGATHGSVTRFVAASVVTIAVSEACYRFVETPIRRGSLGRWWASGDANRPFVLGGAALACLAVTVVYVNVERFDPAAGGEATFELASAPDASAEPGTATGATGAPAADVAPAVTVGAAPTTTAAPVTTAAALPRRLAIVGDSQAHSLAINLPDGIESTFDVVDGSVDGCSVYDAGRVRSRREGFSNSFSMCDGWQSEWADAASRSDVALVVLGAWDVFDIEVDGTSYTFGTPGADQVFLDGLASGVDAMTAAGAKVALLEVPCMRPQDVDGAGVPALPERGDDARVAHVNELLRSFAAARPDTVAFVEGPDAWCGDETIATDLGHRWDGVHVYKPGAALIYETIAPALLSIPV